MEDDGPRARGEPQATLQMRRPMRDVAHIQSSALELSAMMETLTTELMSQQDAVQTIADNTTESIEHVKKGNRQLQQAVQRPSTLREFLVTIIMIFTFVLLFLDWFTD
jgi:t-SNARE complex subunit (syntaxin)